MNQYWSFIKWCVSRIKIDIWDSIYLFSFACFSINMFVDNRLLTLIWFSGFVTFILREFIFQIVKRSYQKYLDEQQKIVDILKNSKE
jgi:putative effector of murein hydrolase